MSAVDVTPRPADQTPVLLKAHDLSVLYPVRGRGGRSVHALENVSVELRAGQVTAVVGESGSGKSTLARALSRLVKPTGGQIWLGDDEVAAQSGRGARAYRREVQLILQDPFSSLNPIHTIGYHLTRPLRTTGIVARADVPAAVDELLTRVNLSPPSSYRERLPHELSGGQLQRVAIARALAVQPKVLLADEPVSMLDVSIRLGVLNLLGDLCARDQLAVLYVTHDIASARYLARTIAVMYAGRLVEQGPAADVVDRPAHPYTQLLLSAAPDPDRGSAPTLTTTGAPPSLIDPPTGCRFHPRCPHAMPVCSAEVPPTIEVAPGHEAACWLLDRPGAAAVPPASTDPHDAGGAPA